MRNNYLDYYDIYRKNIKVYLRSNTWDKIFSLLRHSPPK